MEKQNLAQKLSQIQDLLKEIPNVYLHDIRSFVNGDVSVTKKGVLKLPIELDADEVMNNPDNVMDVFNGNWKIVPILMFVKDDSHE